MNIQKGKFYLTGKGDIALVYDNDSNRARPFLGRIVSKNGEHVRIASWGHSGHYSDKTSEFNLIQEIQFNELPEICVNEGFYKNELVVVNAASGM